MIAFVIVVFVMVSLFVICLKILHDQDKKTPAGRILKDKGKQQPTTKFPCPKCSMPIFSDAPGQRVECLDCGNVAFVPGKQPTTTGKRKPTPTREKQATPIGDKQTTTDHSDSLMSGIHRTFKKIARYREDPRAHEQWGPEAIGDPGEFYGRWFAIYTMIEIAAIPLGFLFGWGGVILAVISILMLVPVNFLYAMLAARHGQTLPLVFWTLIHGLVVAGFVAGFVFV